MSASLANAWLLLALSYISILTVSSTRINFCPDVPGVTYSPCPANNGVHNAGNNSAVRTPGQPIVPASVVCDTLYSFGDVSPAMYKISNDNATQAYVTLYDIVITAPAKVYLRFFSCDSGCVYITLDSNAVGPLTFKTAVNKWRTHSVDTSKTAFKFIVNPALSCGDGWASHCNSCYKYFDDTARNWENAKQHCIQNKAKLASISSKPVDLFVASLAKTDVWIGLTDAAVEGTFVWIDGSTAAYRSWASGHPKTTPLNANDCVEKAKLSSIFNSFKDEVCTEEKEFVCIKPTGVPLNGACQVTDDCGVTDSECKNSVCVCKTDYTATGGRCITTRALGQSCTDSEQCTDNAVCNVNCACDTGYVVIQSINCFPERNLDESCQHDLQCSSVTSNSECKSSACACIFPRVKSATSTCIEPKDLGESCSESAQCTDNAVCNVNCACDTGYVVIQTINCFPERNLDQSCEYDLQCSSVTPNSECYTSEGSACACISPLAKSTSDTCIPQTISLNMTQVLSLMTYQADMATVGSANYQTVLGILTAIYSNSYSDSNFISLSDLKITETESGKVSGNFLYTRKHPDLASRRKRDLTENKYNEKDIAGEIKRHVSHQAAIRGLRTDLVEVRVAKGSLYDYCLSEEDCMFENASCVASACSCVSGVFTKYNGETQCEKLA